MSSTIQSHEAGRYAALVLIVQYFLMLTAYLTLSTAINWPVSLDDPAATALPRVIEQAGPMMFGYTCYLAVGLLFIPATVALNERLGLARPLASFTLALAVFSAIAKSIGITRWLFAMPILARAYVAPGADTATLGAVYEVFNEYAGSIGEILGVSLMSGIWTIVMGLTIFKTPGRFTKPLGGFVFLTALLLLLSVPEGFGVESIFGISMGNLLTLNGIVWQAGLLAIGIWCLTKPRNA
jgi:Domain of unknown function (DUF4386)